MRQDGPITTQINVAAHFAKADGGANSGGDSDAAAGETQNQPRQNSKRQSKYPRITLRLSRDEHDRLKTAAEGMSVSAYVRKCVFGASITPRKIRSRVPVQNEKALAEILARLGASKMANNLNQIAYQANCGSLLMDRQTEEDIKLACAQIAWMRVQLIEALGLRAKDP